MKQSPYIDYLANEIDSHLFRMVDKDRTAYHEAINSMTNNNQLKEHDFSHINSFFDFYFNILEFTPKEIIKAFGVRNQDSLWRVIYDGSNAQINIRIELKDKFKSVLETDFQSYKECLKMCLSTHLDAEQGLKTRIEQFSQYPQIQSIYQRAIYTNQLLFTDLVNIGLKQEFFKQIDKEILRTKNDTYKKILESNHLLDEDSFSLDEYTQLILESYGSKSQRTYRGNKDETLGAYQLHHIESIYPLVKNFSAYQEFAENNLKELDKDNKGYLVISPLRYITLFCAEHNETSKPLQKEFLESWLEEPEVRSLLIKDKYILDNIFVSYEDKILFFLNQITADEYKTLIKETNWTYCSFDKSSYYGTFIHHMVSTSCKMDIPAQDMPKILDKFLSLQTGSEQDMFFGAILSHLTYKFIKKIENGSLTENEKISAIVDVLQIAIKNKNLLFKAINMENNSINNAIDEAEQNLKYIQKYSQEIGISFKDINDLKHQSTKIVNEFFKTKIEPTETYNTEKFIATFQNMLESLNAFKDIDSNSLWLKKFSKQKLNSKNKIIGYDDDFPLVFELLSKTKNLNSYIQIFNEENIDIINNTTFNKKNIFEYIFNNDPKKFSSLILSLSENEDVFNQLVLENKKTIKLIEKTEDLELIKTVDVMKFNYKLKNKLQKPDSPEPSQKRFKL